MLRNESFIYIKKKKCFYSTSTTAGGPGFVLVHRGCVVELHHAGVDPSRAGGQHQGTPPGKLGNSFMKIKINHMIRIKFLFIKTYQNFELHKFSGIFYNKMFLTHMMKSYLQRFSKLMKKGFK